MKRWFKIIPDENNTFDYVVVNISTGEKESLILRNFTGKGRQEKYIRFIRNANNGNCWEAALYHRYFQNLDEVRHYYDCVHH